MHTPDCSRRRQRLRSRGFSLVATLLVMGVLALVIMGLLSLSVIELRRASLDQDVARAQANARLALQHAIGQLQSELGPDQRVSATSGILDDAEDPHWTGVWNTRRGDGTSYWDRDQTTGSLVDSRSAEAWDAYQQVRAWLVSGDADPRTLSSIDDLIEVVGAGSVAELTDRVEVPLVTVQSEDGREGRMAWWTGDLGVRANVSTPDRFAGQSIDPEKPGEGYYRVMVSQQAESAVMGAGLEIPERQRAALPTAGSLELLGESGGSWSRDHFHDFTTSSVGLLVDVQQGGLKGDLTAFFESGGEVPSQAGLAGLSDADPIISGGENTRRRLAGPRFGLLRDWAVNTAPFSGSDVETRHPLTNESDGKLSQALALCNETPVALDGNAGTSLKPIITEASNFIQISAYPLREEYPQRFQLRHHLYPRVVLWNPYNVSITSDDLLVMIQGNGRWEMWTENEHYNRDGRVFFRSLSQWLSFEGGRNPDFGGSIMDSDGYKDEYMGSYYFMVPSTTFGPGESLVFSPGYPAEYDGLSVYNQNQNYNLANNRLSCDVAPDPSRSFYVSGSSLDKDEEDQGLSFRPVRFWFAPTNAWTRGSAAAGIENQTDDTRVVVKKLVGSERVSFERFDELPQFAYISASLQFGAGKEPRIAWDDRRRMDIELLDRIDPRPSIEPDPRTREGIRMRWFEEQFSNILNAGALASREDFFEEAFFANWNPRAAYSVRSPWENIGGSLPSSGSGGGPWFFGLYTRDLPDNAISWDAQEPIFRDGRYHGNPFGPPQESNGDLVMFEVPREETGVVSLGQLQNAQLSEFVWHPSFAIGNSLIDPRLGLAGADGTVPPSNPEEDQLGGFHPDVIGWSFAQQGRESRSTRREEWAETGRALLQNVPGEDHVVYDLSYEVNHALWDRFFVSSGDASAKQQFVQDTVANPLPNGRMVLAPDTRTQASAEDLADYHRAAYHLAVDGAFNVNSTSIEAWKAILASTRDLGGTDGTAFARLLGRVGAEGDETSGWQPFRSLDDDEIDALAREIVVEVKERGPFLSLADFVNRRLTKDESGRMGPLQAAIDRAGINADLDASYPIDNEQPLDDYSHPDNIRDATRFEQTLKPSSKAWGMPGYLTQGDVMQVLGPVLSARSDSFVIRAYGESRDPSGAVKARAWCEAVVQRTPQPLVPDASGLNSADSGRSNDFGRRFIITGFRWLRPDEV